MKKILESTVQAALLATVSALAIVLVTRAVGGPALSINQVSTNKQSTFDVMGESKISTIPDQAEVRMGLTVNESTVKVAQDKANTVINSINERLSQMGIEKANIKTESYTLYPNYDYQPGSGQRITGYSVNANLVVTLKDFAQVNQAIDMATAAGANQIGGISFTLSDEKKAEIEEEARAEAIANAKEKASSLANEAGMKLGKIVNVTETPVASRLPYGGPEAMMDVGRGGGAAAPTNVEPGSTIFTYSVTLSYETL